MSKQIISNKSAQYSWKPFVSMKPCVRDIFKETNQSWRFVTLAQSITHQIQFSSNSFALFNNFNLTVIRFEFIYFVQNITLCIKLYRNTNNLFNKERIANKNKNLQLLAQNTTPKWCSFKSLSPHLICFAQQFQFNCLLFCVCIFRSQNTHCHTANSMQ